MKYLEEPKSCDNCVFLDREGSIWGDIDPINSNIGCLMLIEYSDLGPYEMREIRAALLRYGGGDLTSKCSFYEPAYLFSIPDIDDIKKKGTDFIERFLK